MSSAVTDVHRQRALQATFDPVLLAASHVHFDQLSGNPTLEAVLFDALRAPDPARWELCGPDGAGKSSTISRLVHDLTRMEQSPYEVLMLEVGDIKVLKSATAFARHVIATIATQQHRFASPVQEELQLAGADQVTTQPSRLRHRSGIKANAGVLQVEYAADLSERFQELKWGQSSARAKADLAGIVQSLQGFGRRPVVVIDDTEKFALTEDGNVHAEALTGLAAHAIPLLASLGVDVLMATHPRFSNSSAIRQVRERWLSHVEIPRISMTENSTFPLAAIVDRHLQARGVSATWHEVFRPTVLHQLQSVYLACERNLRTVLNLAQTAVGHAHHEGVERVQTRHLYTAQTRGRSDR